MINKEEQARRLAAIDTHDKAMAALKECAYLSGVFNHDLRLTLERVVLVLESSKALRELAEYRARFDEEKPPTPAASRCEPESE